MPYLKLNTNLPLNNTADLSQRLSRLMAEQTAKPEAYVMVETASSQALLFAGTNAPAAYLECKSIGLSLAQTKPLAAAICALLQQQLALDPARVYIEFSDCSAAYWGWNGSTFA